MGFNHMEIKKIEAKTFPDSLFKLDGISKKTIKEHLKLYQVYVNKFNEINERLAGLVDDDYLKANQVCLAVRELKLELPFAWGGIINHEIYFSHLGGTTSSKVPTGSLLTQIKKDFGSLENFKKDLKATGLAARGWAWTVWNKKNKMLYNHLGDSQNSYLLWGVKPIIALDVYEHAYFIDYGGQRGSYIDAFLNNLNWSVVEKNLGV
jgi:Fe-Mn family superoxide dismutase